MPDMQQPDRLTEKDFPDDLPMILGDYYAIWLQFLEVYQQDDSNMREYREFNMTPRSIFEKFAMRRLDPNLAMRAMAAF